MIGLRIDAGPFGFPGFCNGASIPWFISIGQSPCDAIRLKISAILSRTQPGAYIISSNCFCKQVLISPYRYYLLYRCYRALQQELSCIKQRGQWHETYHIKHSTRQGGMNIRGQWHETYHIKHSTRQCGMNIIFEVSPNDSWRNLEAMSVFLGFVILPPANIQIAIFVIIWWQSGKKVLMIYHQSINLCQK